MRSSPSQCATFERCNRQWYFQKKHKLYPPSNTSQSFGTALHLLCAHHLLGSPPPEDWAKELSKDERAKAERMVAKAVRLGILRRREKLMVEHKFLLRTPHGDQSGIIDVFDPFGAIIEDHKTSNNDRYLQTEATLRQDVPMMIYAGHLLFVRKGDQPAEVVLRHNQFCLKDESVVFAEAKVTPDEVRAYWAARIIPSMKGQNNTISLPQWSGVPGHPKGSEACRAYGGCAFSRICHEGVKLEDFSFTPPPMDRDLPF